MIEYLHAALLRLFGEHLFLIVAVVLEEDARTAGIGVSFEVIVARGLHVDAPVVPHVHDLGAGLKKAHDERRVVAGGVLTVHELVVHHADVPVLFGYPAQEMIVARGACAAALRVGLVQKNDACALVRRRYGGHESGYASADDGDVCFMLLFEGNHG